MPKYDYQCAHGHTREVQHGMNEKPEVTCDQGHENCKVKDCRFVKTATCGLPMTRVFGNADFVLKGTGWYSTDSRVIKTAQDVHGTGI